MLNKRFLLFFVVLVVLVSSVLSVPPVTNTGNEGLDIKFPIQEYLKVGEDYKFHFHIFSRETGLPVTTTLNNCSFHLYNDMDSHIYRAWSDTIVDDWDVEFLVLGGNFSEVGEYSYIIQCECVACSVVAGFDDLGGFASVEFFVNELGVEPVNSFRDVILVHCLLIMVFIVFGVLVFYKTFRNAKRMMFAKYLSFGFLSLALIELVFLFGLLYGSWVGMSLSGLLLFNFYVVVILGFALLFGGLFFFTLSMMDLTDLGEDESVRWEK